MEVIRGKVVEVKPGCIVIQADYNNIDRYARREYGEVQIALEDGRTITPRQRRMAYSLLNAIAEHVGDDPAFIKQTTKHDFVRDHLQGLRKELFSLSSCDETTAREYISYLVELVINFEVPTPFPLAEDTDDIPRYMHTCAVKKVCAVCGRPGEIHHVDRVGMGGDRTEINHIGMECLPLCRGHHQEAHTMTDDEFCKRYHLEAIKIDADIAKANKLKGATK